MCSVTGTVYFPLSVYYYSYLFSFFFLAFVFSLNQRDVMYDSLGNLGARVYASFLTMCI